MRRAAPNLKQENDPCSNKHYAHCVFFHKKGIKGLGAIEQIICLELYELDKGE